MAERLSILNSLYHALAGIQLPSYVLERNPILLNVTEWLVDPLNTASMPQAAVIFEPEDISIGLDGQVDQRTIRANIYATSYALPLDLTGILDASDIERVQDTLYATGEMLLRGIVAALTDPVNVADFNSCGSGGTGGFSISSIGPIYIETFPDETELVYLSIGLGLFSF